MISKKTFKGLINFQRLVKGVKPIKSLNEETVKRDKKCYCTNSIILDNCIPERDCHQCEYFR